MAFSDTLLVRHLPVCLSKADVEDLLKHIGAIKVVVLESKVKKHTAFATFVSKEVAGEALFRLHQKEIYGSRLVVEFARNNERYCDNSNQNSETEKRDSEKKAKLYEAFMKSLNDWTVGLDFTLPPPHHLYYSYPPPTAEVLLNIVNMLSCTTKFYTQVLHLMNKMNLPCPFNPAFPLQENEVFNSFIIFVLENSVYENGEGHTRETSSSENDTELESDTEMTKTNVIPERKLLSQKKPIKRKKLLMPVAPTSSKRSKVASIEEVFEKVDRETPARKIEVKIPSEITQTETSEISAQPLEQSEGFGVILPAKKSIINENESEEKTEPDEECITEEELTLNRVSERGNRKKLPVFKNYQAGVPSCRLYIKNLSKDVQLADLHYIFRRYFVKGADEQGTMFDIRLMQEGRMKGQAFVTLQNVKQAELALKETNGYIIKNKPMVVQFARSAVAK